MYLIDTNVWLHRLLDHDHSQDVEEFLDLVAPAELLITDFTLHSLGVILDRLGRRGAYVEFVRDVLIEGGVEVVSIGAESMERLVSCMDTEGLDFDDAYQYLAAEDNSAELVSYDRGTSTQRHESGRRRPLSSPISASHPKSIRPSNANELKRKRTKSWQRGNAPPQLISQRSSRSRQARNWDHRPSENRDRAFHDAGARAAQ